jgi:hypothetical protein
MDREFGIYFKVARKVKPGVIPRGRRYKDLHNYSLAISGKLEQKNLWKTNKKILLQKRNKARKTLTEYEDPDASKMWMAWKMQRTC